MIKIYLRPSNTSTQIDTGTGVDGNTLKIGDRVNTPKGEGEITSQPFEDAYGKRVMNQLRAQGVEITGDAVTDAIDYLEGYQQENLAKRLGAY